MENKTKKFQLKGKLILRGLIEVEAETKEEAIQKAFEMEASGQIDPRNDWDRVDDGYDVLSMKPLNKEI